LKLKRARFRAILYAGDEYSATCDGCSERGLGFSGYNDDENETFAVATSTKSAELATNRPLTSDINRNPLETARRSVVDNHSATEPSSKHAATKAHERRDENNVEERRDTLPQVNNVTSGKSYVLRLFY